MEGTLGEYKEKHEPVMDSIGHSWTMIKFPSSNLFPDLFRYET